MAGTRAIADAPLMPRRPPLTEHEPGRGQVIARVGDAKGRQVAARGCGEAAKRGSRDRRPCAPAFPPRGRTFPLAKQVALAICFQEARTSQSKLMEKI